MFPFSLVYHFRQTATHTYVRRRNSILQIRISQQKSISFLISRCATDKFLDALFNTLLYPGTPETALSKSAKTHPYQKIFS